MSAQQKRSIEELTAELSDLSVLDMAKLKAALEDKWGVQAAAAPMAMAAAPAVAAEKVAESTEFEVVLESVTADKKIAVIKVVRELTGLGLKEAKEFADSATATDPKVIKSPCSKQEADDICSKFKDTGGVVKVKGLN